MRRSPKSRTSVQHEKRQIRRALARGTKEIAEGKGYDLEHVLRQADRILLK